MHSVEVVFGHARQPYAVAARGQFHTEFAAELFGRLFCEQAGLYHYWRLG